MAPRKGTAAPDGNHRPERLDLGAVRPELRDNPLVQYLATAPDEELQRLDELAEDDRRGGPPNPEDEPDDET